MSLGFVNGLYIIIFLWLTDSGRPMGTNLHKVFVYGTLKQGQPNHHWFSKQKDAYYKFLSQAETTEKYPLIVATKYNIPFLLYSPGMGHHVQGELYEVDDVVFGMLDILEDHPNFYQREEQSVTDIETKKEEKAWIYFIKNFKPQLLEKQFVKVYNDGDYGLQYVVSEESTLEDLNDIMTT